MTLPQPSPDARRLRAAAGMGTSSPVTSSSDTPKPQGPPREYFTRARAKPPPRSRAVVKVLLFLLVLWGLGKALFAERVGLRAVTPRGLTTLKPDMPRADVDRAFGGPFAREPGSRSDCLLYGQPSMKPESFAVYRVCYRDGKVSEVSQKKYEAWGFDETGLTAPPAAP